MPALTDAVLGIARQLEFLDRREDLLRHMNVLRRIVNPKDFPTPAWVLLLREEASVIRRELIRSKRWPAPKGESAKDLESGEGATLVRYFAGSRERPKIVLIVGDSFSDEASRYARVQAATRGALVIRSEPWAGEDPETSQSIAELALRRIDLADSVAVAGNRASCEREIEYAQALGKDVVFLFDHSERPRAVM